MVLERRIDYLLTYLLYACVLCGLLDFVRWERSSTSTDSEQKKRAERNGKERNGSEF